MPIILTTSKQAHHNVVIVTENLDVFFCPDGEINFLKLEKSRYERTSKNFAIEISSSFKSIFFEKQSKVC